MDKFEKRSSIFTYLVVSLELAVMARCRAALPRSRAPARGADPLSCDLVLNRNKHQAVFRRIFEKVSTRPVILGLFVCTGITTETLLHSLVVV